MNEILQDTTKFEKLRKNPIDKQKKDLNNLIDAANAEIGGVKFSRIIGEFNPGYFYGNPKTHKEGAPIRPIISQIPTPSYEVAKALNALISPYLPKTYSLKSSDEFIQILKVKERHGILASLDASSLFTNVPVDITIDIILKNVYENHSIPAPRLPKHVLEKMLEICTKETPFRCPSGKLYRQIDGVAMGSPLGVLFAEAYMAHVESKAIDSMETKPHTYCRYVDDIFVDIQNEEHLDSLRTSLQQHSVLSFTTESSVNHKIPFLDVQIDATDNTFVTTVFKKPTDRGHCLSGDSECPDQYKESVIRAYINRAIKHCSTWPLLHQELQRVRQLLVNNRYKHSDIDEHIHRQLHKHLARPNQADKPNDDQSTQIKLYYQGSMSTAYKKDEKILRDIV